MNIKVHTVVFSVIKKKPKEKKPRKKKKKEREVPARGGKSRAYSRRPKQPALEGPMAEAGRKGGGGRTVPESVNRCSCRSPPFNQTYRLASVSPMLRCPPLCQFLSPSLQPHDHLASSPPPPLLSLSLSPSLHPSIPSPSQLASPFPSVAQPLPPRGSCDDIVLRCHCVCVCIALCVRTLYSSVLIARVLHSVASC